MIEENVVSAAGAHYTMTQDEMEHLIRRAGYQPRQRTNLYERFVTRADTAELAQRYRHALTPEKRELAGGLLPVVA
jgi:2-iminoacetate synthase ThiH